MLIHLQKVFAAMEEAGFKLNRDKCRSATTRIRFLGHDIVKETVRIAEEIKQSILQLGRP